MNINVAHLRPENLSPIVRIETDDPRLWNALRKLAESRNIPVYKQDKSVQPLAALIFLESDIESLAEEASLTGFYCGFLTQVDLTRDYGISTPPHRSILKTN